jgi:hypothetical protein
VASATHDSIQPERGWGRLRLVLLAAGCVFFVAHAVALPRTLGDIDSINLALGVESFDVAAHRPHPPGYPVYIAVARVSTALLGVVAPSWDRDQRAATGLALLGLIAGTLAAFVLAKFWIVAGLRPLMAVLAAVVGIACPLFWFTAARPLSDVPGLIAALVVQIGFMQGWRARAGGIPRAPTVWLWASFGVGLLIGFRSQALWLTAPFLAWCVGDLLVRGQRRDAGLNLLAAAAGVIVWAVPLVWLSGGIGPYLDAVWFQGREDLTGIELLATRSSPTLFVQALERTFLRPWQATTLGAIVLGLAIAGAIRLAGQAPRVLAVIVLGFSPYLAFHLTFHETVTLRYALPLVVPMAGLAVVGLGLGGARLAMIGAAALAVVGVSVAQPRVQAYAFGGAPVFPAFQAMHRALPDEPVPPVLRMHHQVWWGIRRAIEWYQPVWPGVVPPHPGDREWLDVVGHWTSGRREPIWFLGELTRTDLAAFDPRTTRLVGRYVLPASVRDLVGGARLDSMTWWRLNRPFWMVGRGWSLTPEIAGMTAADGTAPHLQPAKAFLLRQPGPVRLMIGGRYLSPAGEPDAIVSVELDGRPIAEWTRSAEAPWFVEWIDLPGGVPDGPEPYARLAVRVTSADPEHPVAIVGLEQFDAAPQDAVMYAFADGWYEYETNTATGQSWRWMSGRSTIDIRGATTDVTLVMTGESPRRDFDRAPTVVVRAQGRELARFTPAHDFSERVLLPADVLAGSGGRVTIETDLTFSPAERGQSADQRRLGLRITHIEVTSAPRALSR